MRFGFCVLATIPLVMTVACGSMSRELQPVAASVAAPAMSPEEMQRKMTELATPGANHQRLEPMVGRFTAKGTFWMDPTQPPVTFLGTSVSSWLFDGRFVKEEMQADFMGQPFTGIGLTGFDNATQKYQGVWIDSMGTMMMPVSSGTADASGKVITSTRSVVDPATGVRATTREVTTVIDADHHRFDWYETGPDGVEVHKFQLEYTRAK